MFMVTTDPLVPKCRMCSTWWTTEYNDVLGRDDFCDNMEIISVE